MIQEIYDYKDTQISLNTSTFRRLLSNLRKKWRDWKILGTTGQLAGQFHRKSVPHGAGSSWTLWRNGNTETILGSLPPYLRYGLKSLQIAVREIYTGIDAICTETIDTLTPHTKRFWRTPLSKSPEKSPTSGCHHWIPGEWRVWQGIFHRGKTRDW